jgi:5'-nucleotidase
LEPAILVSNDDGYQAPGILALAEAMRQKWRTIIVAPQEDQSGKSNALTVSRPLRLEDHGADHYSVNGYPADCVKLALSEHLNVEFHAVVSGINNGPNLGLDIYYSGTVGAAREGLINRVPSFAFSLTGYERGERTFRQWAPRAADIVNHFIENPVEDGTLINVNFPHQVEEPADTPVRWARMGLLNYGKGAKLVHDPFGRPYYWLDYERVDNPDPLSDHHIATKDNCVSVSALTLDATSGGPSSHRLGERIPLD